ncbi:MAG: hypothetical protein OXU21_14335 [Chloroflexota bacterium]|nr:hypothetical protein [Chloroflexota bacterium]
MTDRDDYRPLQQTRGETVRLNRQPVGVVRAENAIVRGGSVRHIQTDVLQSDASAIGVARTDALATGQTLVGGVAAREATVRNSAVAGAVTANAKLENVAASWVVAGNVQADRVLTLAVVGANIQGNVRALFGPRAAVAFGVALGLSTLFARLIGRLLK